MSRSKQVVVVSSWLMLAVGAACRVGAPESTPNDPPAVGDDPGPGNSDADTDLMAGGRIEITLYFTHVEGVIDGDCEAVRSVTRTVAAEPDVPTLAIRLLLEGPTEHERSRSGVSSPFERDGSMPGQQDLRRYFTRVVIEGDAAVVEFDDPMAWDYFAREACRQGAMDAAFEHTLRGLPGIARVRHRVAGREVGDERGA
ncbi:GerMN domain-containing protein [Paraliomyxa miuraensis]|uniref:GerMN domain-containing protein n=1 Tax=Paraliomyxa miuraensis TaxID=376150 RepID=UPI00225BB1F1|nr:GerMN domain-containing protein [Paraliomyxa miuraensis]MCX4247681.1 GerMN domain-containing protein [Paraliomyxa miuraensis]